MILGKKDRARVAELEAQVEELKNEAREEMRKTTHDLLEKRNLEVLLETSNARERKLRAELADRTAARREPALHLRRMRFSSHGDLRTSGSLNGSAALPTAPFGATPLGATPHCPPVAR